MDKLKDSKKVKAKVEKMKKKDERGFAGVLLKFDQRTSFRFVLRGDGFYSDSE